MTMVADPSVEQGPPWLPEATCQVEGYATEFFTDLAPAANVDAAAAVCRRCPVRWECLWFAIEQEDRLAAITDEAPDRAYVYGGYRPDEREWLSLAMSAATVEGGPIDDPAAWLASVADDVLSH